MRAGKWAENPMVHPPGARSLAWSQTPVLKTVVTAAW
jgi:hypothetical protein